MHAHDHYHLPADPHVHDGPGEIPVLDIGDDVGALLVYLDGPTPSGELHARPLGEPGARFHTGVHARELVSDTTHVALYPEIRRGTYEILDADFEPLAVVDIDGGAVTELDLRA
ncbi:MAG TPA: hypothetical protein VGZ52_01355 [Acidimicrobiales bacterium]|jgi:hypothetical protein|nr:hypothetical protein [Acidimicrobiales bacterium]